MTKTRIALVIMTLAYALTIATAPASAFKEFIQKPMKAGFEIKGGTQTFTTKAGAVECLEAKGNGDSPGEKSATIPTNVEYAKCKAFGLAEAKVTPIEYKLYASGKASIQSKATILATNGKAECGVEVAPEYASGKNNELGTVAYVDIKPGITAEMSLIGITYKITKNVNSGCGIGTVGEAKNGEYKGAVKTVTTEAGLCIYTIVAIGYYTERNCATVAMPFYSGYYEKVFGFTSLEAA